MTGALRSTALAVAAALSLAACGGTVGQAGNARPSSPYSIPRGACEGMPETKCRAAYVLAGLDPRKCDIATGSGCIDGPVTPPPSLASPTAGATCIFGANGVDVEVQLTDQPSCATDQQALASFGLNWYPIARLSQPGAAGSADGETMALTCALVKGASAMTVMDAGGAYYGNQICSSEEQAGWTSP